VLISNFEIPNILIVMMYYKNKNMNIGFYCDSAMFTTDVLLHYCTADLKRAHEKLRIAVDTSDLNTDCEDAAKHKRVRCDQKLSSTFSMQRISFTNALCSTAMLIIMWNVILSCFEIEFQSSSVAFLICLALSIC